MNTPGYVQQAVDTTLALLPLSWRGILEPVVWVDATINPIRTTDPRLAAVGQSAAIGIEEGIVTVALADLNPRSIVRGAVHAMNLLTGYDPSESQPISELYREARVSRRSIDAQFFESAYSASLESPEEFLAQLVAFTLTHPDHDPAHPVLHPDAERLWPDARSRILAIEHELQLAHALSNDPDVAVGPQA